MFGGMDLNALLQGMNAGGAGGMGGGMGGMGGMGGFGGFGAPASTATMTDEELKVKYTEQLGQMKEMGFIDDGTNLDMLKQTNGNVQVAIERLLGMLG
jgi:ubiquilin